MTAAFNPYRREQVLLWHNRVARWRAEPDESAFHALALGLLALFGVVGLWQAWPHVIATVQSAVAHWPLATSVLILLVSSQLHTLALRSQRARWTEHWLVAQPIDDRLRRHILLRRTLVRLALHAVLLAVALYLAAASVRMQLAGLGIVVVAAAMGWWRGVGSTRVVASMPRRETVLAVRGSGSFWTWQWAEAVASLAPYRVSKLAWLVLLLPMGDWRLIWPALELMALGLAIVAWSRALAVLPAAQRWLAAESMPASRLLLACARLPVLIVSTFMAALVLMLWASGAVIAAPILIAVLPLAALHWACTAAERRRPARIGLQMSLNLALLIGVLQAMPVLVAPLWLAQMLMLLRRALR